MRLHAYVDGWDGAIFLRQLMEESLRLHMMRRSHAKIGGNMTAQRRKEGRE